MATLQTTFVRAPEDAGRCDRCGSKILEVGFEIEARSGTVQDGALQVRLVPKATVVRCRSCGATAELEPPITGTV